jgi:hypothetical protein
LNVRELVEELLLLDGELEIITQIDEEGNGYTFTNGVEMVYADIDPGSYYIDSVRSFDSCVEGCEEDGWEDCNCEGMELRVLIW